jgi:dTDP-4-dehydrorhamnose reductase
MMKNIVLLGCNGQLGKELQATAPSDYRLFSYPRSAIDVTDKQQLSAIGQHQPALVINASAYTAVDKAESDPAIAYAINTHAVQLMGELCADIHARLIHVSTDFVFDGEQSSPYLPGDKTNPQSIYGDSKLKGELSLAAVPGLDYLVIRTSWVHSAKGNNFVKTMLKLFEQRDSLSVVNDQLGSPTWAHNLARAIWSFSQQPSAKGIYHYADAGIISWYDFAVAIQQEAIAAGWPDTGIRISPIPASDYPTPAKRPAYSALDCQSTEQALAMTRQPWREALRSMLQELKAQP